MRCPLILTLCLALATPALAKVSDCRTLAQNVPTRLGATALTARENLEKDNRGTGFQLRYAGSKGEMLSIYFYDRGKDRFSEKTLAAELSVSASNLYRITDRDKNITDGDIYFDRPDTPKRGLFGLAFLFLEIDGRRLHNEYLTIGTVDRCMMKVIYSVPGPRGRSNRKFDQMLHDLMTHLERT